MAASLQMMQKVRGEHPHLLYKLLLPGDQTLDQLTKDGMNFIQTAYDVAGYFLLCLECENELPLNH